MILRYLFNDPNLLTKGISYGYFNKKPGYDLKSAPVNRPLCSIPHLKCNELIWTSPFCYIAPRRPLSWPRCWGPLKTLMVFMGGGVLLKS